MKCYPWLALLLLVWEGLPVHPKADEPGSSLQFQEVYQAVKGALTNVSEAELNRAAITGFLEALHGQAVLGTNAAASPGTNGQPALARASVLENAYAHIRLAQVDARAPSEFLQAYESLRSTNKLKGLILDLRFAGGGDYAGAARIADAFVETERPLIRWAGQEIKSTIKTNGIRVPAAVLINKETSGAAEALAGILKQVDAGLLIGTPTAGRALQFKETALSNGQVLRVAKSPVEIAGAQPLTSAGLAPDIAVNVSLVEECAWLEDPYKTQPGAQKIAAVIPAPTTNRTSRRTINEAELVRRHREGFELDPSDKKAEDAGPLLSDAALNRSLDFLKGLAMMRRLAKP